MEQAVFLVGAFICLAGALGVIGDLLHGQLDLDPSRQAAKAGPVTFDITNSSSSRSEFEVRTSKPSIVT